MKQINLNAQMERENIGFYDDDVLAESILL